MIAIALGVVSAPASAAACSALLWVAPLEGEPFEEARRRSDIAEQAHYRSQADAVFLAEASMIRRVGTEGGIETTFTPVYLFRGIDGGVEAATLLGGVCDRYVVGDLYVVYGRLEEGHWSAVGVVDPSEFDDPDIGMIMRRVVRGLRVGERGELPPPVYPE